jgi:hypothetical protein
MQCRMMLWSTGPLGCGVECTMCVSFMPEPITYRRQQGASMYAKYCQPCGVAPAMWSCPSHVELPQRRTGRACWSCSCVGEACTPGCVCCRCRNSLLHMLLRLSVGCCASARGYESRFVYSTASCGFHCFCGHMRQHLKQGRASLD